jgi:hypothetical protein
MEKGKKIIDLPAQERERLCKIFGVKGPVISQSLTFYRNGPIHQRIRLAAMRNGGKLLMEQHLWDVEMLKQ